MRFFFLLSLIVFAAITFGSSRYSEVKILFADKEDVRELARSGLIFDHVGYQKEKNGFSYTAILDENEINILEASGLAFEILIDDLVTYKKNKFDKSVSNRLLDANDPLKYFELGSMAGYYTPDEIIAELDSMYLLFPNLITQKDSIGSSHEGRAIWMLKISDNPDIDEDEPELLYTALHHAREPQSMTTVIYFMYYLLENYGSDPEITYLVDNRELYFVPVINPDGYNYNYETQPDGFGFWRKNKRDNDENGSFNSNTDGVDLNRNYGYEWGYDDNGSSPNFGSNAYRGPEAFSEPELKAIRDLCESRQFRIALNYHSYSNLLIYPWGYIASFETPDSLIFRSWTAEMTKFNNYLAGTGDETVGYLVNGDSDDWMYGEQFTKNKIFSMTPEVGTVSDGFWPEIERIYPLAQENVFPNLFAAWVSGSKVIYKDFKLLPLGDNDSFLEPGEQGVISFELQNSGLEAIAVKEIEWSFLQVDPFIELINSDLVGLQDSLKTEDTLWTNNFWFKVDSSAPSGYIPDIQMSINQQGIETIYSIEGIIIGEPIELFTDDAEIENDTWTFQQNWARSSKAAYEGDFGFSDSPTGEYKNETNISMQLDSLIDLSDAQSAFLQFHSHWDIEAGYDFGRVQVSTTGNSWTSLAGLYTKPGSGIGAQGKDEPGYDGVQNSWVKETINLNDYIGEQIYLRFNLSSDEFLTKDGWSIDNIKVLKYSDSVTDISDKFAELPKELKLYPNYPNPFNPSTNIRYSLPKAGNVQLEIFDSSGRKVRSLINDFQSPGDYTFLWNGKSDSGESCAAGIYFYTLKSAKEVLTQKLVLLK